MYLLGFWRRWVLLSDAGELIGETKLDPAVTELYNQFAGIQQGTLPPARDNNSVANILPTMALRLGAIVPRILPMDCSS